MFTVSTVLLLLLLLGLTTTVVRADASAQTCSIDPNEIDPALVEMEYVDLSDGKKKKTMVYMEPDVTTFYEGQELPASTKVVPKFNGFAGKFINLSENDIILYWESHKGARPNLLRYFAPWSTGGTATFPGHRFFFASNEDSTAEQDRLIEFVVDEYPNNLYIYDPYTVPGDKKATEAKLSKLSRKDRQLYDMWKTTLNFSDQYLNVTGRTYLSNYLRPPPTHYMWRADYFGQEHWVTSKEVHFNTLPPQSETQKIKTYGKDRKLREDEPRLLSQYRVQDTEVLNMTLKVLSCRPRVFEIPNFLSETEIQHILQIADAIELGESTTGDVGSDTSGKVVDREEEKRRKTRTSLNSWVQREETPIIDAIYRRAADLMRIDESLLRYRSKGEYDHLPTKKTIAESLQLVHYGVTQEVSFVVVVVVCFTLRLDPNFFPQPVFSSPPPFDLSMCNLFEQNTNKL